MDSYRKKHIAELLVEAGELIQDRPDITISQIMATVFRSKNMQGENKDPFHMTDLEFSSALTTTLKDLKTLGDDEE